MGLWKYATCFLGTNSVCSAAAWNITAIHWMLSTWYPPAFLVSFIFINTWQRRMQTSISYAYTNMWLHVINGRNTSVNTSGVCPVKHTGISDESNRYRYTITPYVLFIILWKYIDRNNLFDDFFFRYGNSRTTLFHDKAIHFCPLTPFSGINVGQHWLR